MWGNLVIMRSLCYFCSEEMSDYTSVNGRHFHHALSGEAGVWWFYYRRIWSEKDPITPFLPLIPENRNLCRFLFSGINGKNGAMGSFSDHKSSPTRVGFLWPPGYTFYSRSCTSTYKFCLTQVGWFVLWLIRVYLETRELNLRLSINR